MHWQSDGFGLECGMSHVEILKDFPDLTGQDIRACLACAADRERKVELHTSRLRSD